MSKEKIERILSTYPPVEGMPGYVWVTQDTYVELRILRKVYEEHFAEVGEKDND